MYRKMCHDVVNHKARSNRLVVDVNVSIIDEGCDLSSYYCIIYYILQEGCLFFWGSGRGVLYFCVRGSRPVHKKLVVHVRLCV